MCPSDNDSTILLIFDEPRHEEYLVQNDTGINIKFAKFDHSTKNNFHEPITIPAKETSPFVWNDRDKLVKRIQVFIEDNKSLITLDKCTEGDQKIKICKTKKFIYYSSVRLSTEGTKIVHITEKHREEVDIDEEAQKKGNMIELLSSTSGSCRYEFSFKGFGISLIDNKPKELLYITLNELDLEYTFNSRELKNSTENNEEITRFMMDIGNI